MNFYGRDFLKLLDYTPEEIEYLIKLAIAFKEKKKKGEKKLLRSQGKGKPGPQVFGPGIFLLFFVCSQQTDIHRELDKETCLGGRDRETLPFCFPWTAVALPQPEGPTTAANSPGNTWKDTWERAGVSPDFV